MCCVFVVIYFMLDLGGGQLWVPVFLCDMRFDTLFPYVTVVSIDTYLRYNHVFDFM